MYFALSVEILTWSSPCLSVFVFVCGEAGEIAGEKTRINRDRIWNVRRMARANDTTVSVDLEADRFWVRRRLWVPCCRSIGPHALVSRFRAFGLLAIRRGKSCLLRLGLARRRRVERRGPGRGRDRRPSPRALAGCARLALRRRFRGSCRQS